MRNGRRPFALAVLLALIVGLGDVREQAGPQLLDKDDDLLFAPFSQVCTADELDGAAVYDGEGRLGRAVERRVGCVRSRPGRG